MLPAVLDGAATQPSPVWSAWGRRWGARLARAMPYVIALAMLLPTMHQSSLGGLMIVAGPKLHPLWHTTLLPLLALVSCLSMGLGAVVVLTALMKHVLERASTTTSCWWTCRQVNGGLLVLFAGLRFADLPPAGKLGLLAVPDFFLIVFVLEMALFLIPAFVFLTRAGRERPHPVRGRAVDGGGRARSGGSTPSSPATTPASPSTYWPSWGEIAVTVGMAAIGVAVFITVTRLLPVVVVQDTPVPASIAAFVLSSMSRPDGEAGKDAAESGGPGEPSRGG